MKKGISILLLITQVLFLNAQSLTVTGDNSVLTSDVCLTTHSYLTVKNISNKEQTILCVKNVIDTSGISGSSNYFCWGGTCYGSGTLISSDSLILPSGQADNSSFGGYFDAYCASGSATIEYCFYPINDPDDKSCIMVTYHGAATEIIENEFNMDEFFPNPAKEYTTINYKSGKNSHLKIIDILGNMVKDIHLSNVGTQDIYVGDLSKGMYFGNLIHNDKVVAVKKLIIK